MQLVEIPALGKRVSRIGLGCARLDGRVGLRRSAALLETALDLGITYFDVAASYGAAEEAVGHVLGDRDDVVVATKVGPPRPPYNELKMRAKSFVKPALDRVRVLKGLLRGPGVPPPRDASQRPRYDFSQQAIEASLEASLERLRRSRVDIFLAHEPNRLDLTPEVAARFQTLVDRGLVGAYGVGVDVRDNCWAPFGSVWQSGWPGPCVADYRDEVFYTFHGVLRYEPKDRLGRTETPVAELVQHALRARPGALFIVSASTPERLKELVEAADGGA